MPASARELFEQLVSGIVRRDWVALSELYAPDAVVDVPFRPQRIEGREALERHFAAAGEIPLRFEVANVVVHETTDPEVVVAEFDYEGHVTTAGEEFSISNIQVLRARDGHITETRDYHDHVTLARLLGAR